MTSNPAKPLYREPVQLNAQLHRHKRLRPNQDHSILGSSHAAYLNAVEFAQAALSFPIVFVPASAANPRISPVAMLGLTPNSNLFVDGARWDARYMPAFFRRLPYLTAPLPGTDQVGVYIDARWEGLERHRRRAAVRRERRAGAGAAAGDRLPAGLRRGVAADRTAVRAAAGARAVHRHEGRCDVARRRPPLSVDGFMVVDENKLRELPDATVLALHRDGVLALLHWHLLSLNHVGELVNRHARRFGSAA